MKEFNLLLIIARAYFVLFTLACSGGEPIFQVTKIDPVVTVQEVQAIDDGLDRILQGLEKVKKDIAAEEAKPKSVQLKPRVGNYPPAYSADRFGRQMDTTIDHLVRDHHEDPAFVKSLTPEERNRLHGKHHTVRAYVPAQTGNCANSQCGLPMRRGRRR